MRIQPESIHASEDALELYTLNMLKGKDRESIESHLLTCELCILSAEAVYGEIAVMRQALRQYIEVATTGHGWRQIANVSFQGDSTGEASIAEPLNTLNLPNSRRCGGATLVG
jgi:hypothetical protein